MSAARLRSATSVTTGPALKPSGRLAVLRMDIDRTWSPPISMAAATENAALMSGELSLRLSDWGQPVNGGGCDVLE